MTGVRIGTAERDSTFLSQGHALKTVLERHPALAPVEVSTSGHASVENANRLQANDIDFGFMASNWIGRAKNGEAPFTQIIDLRMVAPMNAGPLFFIARAHSDLRTVTDLRGRRDELPRLNALFDGLAALFEPLRSDGASVLEFGGVALHPGAVAAYRSAGLLA